MHNPESLVENETHRILRNFEIQTDYPFPVRSDIILINKKKITSRKLGFAGQTKRWTIT